MCPRDTDGRGQDATLASSGARLVSPPMPTPLRTAWACSGFTAIFSGEGKTEMGCRKTRAMSMFGHFTRGITSSPSLGTGTAVYTVLSGPLLSSTHSGLSRNARSWKETSGICWLPQAPLRVALMEEPTAQIHLSNEL